MNSTFIFGDDLPGELHKFVLHLRHSTSFVWGSCFAGSQGSYPLVQSATVIVDLSPVCSVDL